MTSQTWVKYVHDHQPDCPDEEIEDRLCQSAFNFSKLKPIKVYIQKLAEPSALKVSLVVTKDDITIHN
jgi:hypothetical protein